jgi:hypothetical protein
MAANSEVIPGAPGRVNQGSRKTGKLRLEREEFETRHQVEHGV